MGLSTEALEKSWGRKRSQSPFIPFVGTGSPYRIIAARTQKKRFPARRPLNEEVSTETPFGPSGLGPGGLRKMLEPPVSRVMVETSRKRVDCTPFRGLLYNVRSSPLSEQSRNSQTRPRSTPGPLSRGRRNRRPGSRSQTGSKRSPERPSIGFPTPRRGASHNQ